MTDADSSAPRRLPLAIFVVCFASLLLEISYTRVISFKLFYYFSYLVIGLALLGLGSGGVLVAVSRRFAQIPLERILAAGALLASIAVALGYGVVAELPTNTSRLSQSPVREISRLLILCLALFASFLPIGVMIATLLARNPGRIDRLYFADLAGAGAACALVVPLLVWLTPPGCIALAALLLATVAAGFSRGSSPPLFAASLVAGVLCAGVVAFPGSLPEPVTDGIKTIHPSSRRVFSAWDPVFRIDVTESNDRLLLLHHDGMIGSTLHRYDGDPASLGRFDTDPRAYAFRVAERPIGDVLIVGAAGGHEILSSLYFGAQHVTALELNATTVSLLTDRFADYSGHIATDPRVRLIHAEARSQLAREDGRFDLIFFVAPDSYSAQNAATAGAFVLSESYLYTAEMIEEALDHLSPGGIIAMQFGEYEYERKPNRTARYVATARLALTHLGVTDAERHILVATSPGLLQLSTILVKREAFTDEEVDRFLETTRRIPGAMPRQVPGRIFDDGPVNQILALPADALPAWYAAQPYDLSPVRDDAPFFWHFVRFRTALRTLFDPLPAKDREDAVGERLLLVLLALAVLFAGVFLLLPFLAIRDKWAALPHKARSFGLFAMLGCGFMFFEIALIQKLVLFLGHPTYSLTVTLMALLVSTGLGSLASGRLGGRSGRPARILFGAIALLTAFYQFGADFLMDALLGAPLLARAGVAVAMIAPLGFVLGSFMPLGLAALAASTEHAEAYVAWGWAVNGFFSVIGSVLTTLLSMALGFRVVLFFALAAYALAALLLRSLLASGRSGSR